MYCFPATRFLGRQFFTGSIIVRIRSNTSTPGHHGINQNACGRACIRKAGDFLAVASSTVLGLWLEVGTKPKPLTTYLHFSSPQATPGLKASPHIDLTRPHTKTLTLNPRPQPYLASSCVCTPRRMHSMPANVGSTVQGAGRERSGARTKTRGHRATSMSSSRTGLELVWFLRCCCVVEYLSYILERTADVVGGMFLL